MYHEVSHLTKFQVYLARLNSRTTLETKVIQTSIGGNDRHFQIRCSFSVQRRPDANIAGIAEHLKLFVLQSTAGQGIIDHRVYAAIGIGGLHLQQR